MNRIHPQHIPNNEQDNIVLNCISWNVRGWGGRQDKIKKKMRKIKGEIEGYDIIILTETHLSKDEEEITKMEKNLQEYNMYHVHDKINASGRKGVSICLKKNTINIEEVEITSDEGNDDEGRWIQIKLNKILDKPINIWGIYAPTEAKTGKKWMKKLGCELRKEDG